MVAGASGTAHTLAHGGDERTDGTRRAAAGRPAGRRRAAAPAAAPRRRRPALGPARRRRSSAASPSTRSPVPPGPSCCCSSPRRSSRSSSIRSSRPCSARGSRAGWRSSSSTPASSRRWRFVGTLLANPIADQFSTFRDDVPSIVRSANERLDDVQDYFDRKNINIEVTKQGQTALQTLQKRVVGGTDQVVSFGTDLVTRARDGRLRRDPRLRPVGLHAHLRRADRRPRAVGDAARRRDAARTTSRPA